MVNWAASPRIITIAASEAGLTVTAQDLVDTLRQIEDEPENLAYDHLLDAAGKQVLGVGVAVGITVILQNAKIKFADRSPPTYVQCSVTGGNLVAVDANGASMSPIEPSAYTQVMTQASTSPSIAENDKPAIADAVWDELKADHEIPGSLAVAMQELHARGAFGIVADTDAGTVKIYDGVPGESPLLYTLTRTKVGNVYTIVRT